MANIFNEAAPLAGAQVNLGGVFAPRAAVNASAVGRYFIDKYRNAARERGYDAVARQLRKQGVPLAVALQVLGFRERAS